MNAKTNDWRARELVFPPCCFNCFSFLIGIIECLELVEFVHLRLPFYSLCTLNIHLFNRCDIVPLANKKILILMRLNSLMRDQKAMAKNDSKTREQNKRVKRNFVDVYRGQYERVSHSMRTMDTAHTHECVQTSTMRSARFFSLLLVRSFCILRICAASKVQFRTFKSEKANLTARNFVDAVVQSIVQCTCKQNKLKANGKHDVQPFHRNRNECKTKEQVKRFRCFGLLAMQRVRSKRAQFLVGDCFSSRKNMPRPMQCTCSRRSKLTSLCGSLVGGPTDVNRLQHIQQMAHSCIEAKRNINLLTARTNRKFQWKNIPLCSFCGI